MTERVILPGQRYYAGGTVSKIAGHDGVKDVPMIAAEYAPDIQPILPKRVYKGGTTTSISENKNDENTDDMGRELIS